MNVARVSDHPWYPMAAGAGVGLLFFFLYAVFDDERWPYAAAFGVLWATSIAFTERGRQRQRRRR